MMLPTCLNSGRVCNCQFIVLKTPKILGLRNPQHVKPPSITLSRALWKTDVETR
jgi:hypothetical protein